MPFPYILTATSSPNPGQGADDKVWVEWYTTEHLPDMVNSQTASRACLYLENYDSSSPDFERPIRKFLAVYQTQFKECIKSPNYIHHVRRASNLFTGGAASKHGQFNDQYYSVTQYYNPRGLDESPSPSIMTVEFSPIDENKFSKWFGEEYFGMFTKLPGYQRSTLCIAGPRSRTFKGEDPPKYFAIHECDDLNEFMKSYTNLMNTAPEALDQLRNSKVHLVRAWNLVKSEGF